MNATSPKRDQTGADETASRRRILQALAKADRGELESAYAGLTEPPVTTRLRGPETGLVMVRGRIGGGGDPFNLGETTVTRATLKLGTGEIGHAQMLGTDARKAELAALFDALGQRDDHRDLVDRLVTAIEARLLQEDNLRDEQTAATRVDFFTMVRGDD